MKLSPEHLRIVDDAAATYAAWAAAERRRRSLDPPVLWRNLNGVDYLYERRSTGWGSSQGRRSAETEGRFLRYQTEIGEVDAILAETGERLAILAAQYRGLRLPRLHSVIGKICREFDLRGMMGNSVMLIGTNSIPVYEIEAQERWATGLSATQDCDFAFAPQDTFTLTGPRPIMSVLKAADPNFTVNLEKEYQALNRGAYAIDMVMAPSVAREYPPGEPLRAATTPIQEYLLRGRRLSHVLFDFDSKPVPITVPDPRWMALSKLYLADQPDREPLKRSKDREQGKVLARAVVASMPHYPVNDAFRDEVPPELKQYLPEFPQMIRPAGLPPPS